MPLGAARFGLSGADLGKLELIETQTVSGVTTVAFTSIKETIYNVHFMTFNDINFSAGSDRLDARYSNDGGSTYESGSNYQRAHQAGNTSPNFTESRSTSETSTRVSGLSDTGTNDTAQGYNFFYNLGDSSKYSFNSMQATSQRTPNYEMRFGSGVYAVAETINAIQLLSNKSSNFSGTISLYGIAES